MDGSSKHPGAVAAIFRQTPACNFAATRNATRTAREFLAGHGLDEQELFACELCLAEACNNAVQYAPPEASGRRIGIEVFCSDSEIELRVADHTGGFALPDHVPPPAPEAERGRGLYLIKSLTDEVCYCRGDQANILVMRKRRPSSRRQAVALDAPPESLDEARRRLKDCESTIAGMVRELCFRSESLSAIFRCCAELGEHDDLEGFARRLLTDLSYLCGADWFVLRFHNRPGGRNQDLICAPRSADFQPGRLLPAETEAMATRRMVPIASATRSRSAPALPGQVYPLLFGDTLVGTLAIGWTQPAAGFSRLQTAVIRTFAEFLAIQIATALEREQRTEDRLLAREIEIARNIQQALLPRVLPAPPDLAIAGSCSSAREVGGDFYDVVSLDDDTLLFVVADVMGKGVPASMFATITRSLVRALADRARDPAALLERLNELLCPDLEAVEMFITIQVALADLPRRRLVVASAGHCPLLVSSCLGALRSIRSSGPPLGIEPGAVYRQDIATWEPGGRLLLYTDGLPEARNPDGAMYGAGRLARWFCDPAHAGLGPARLKSLLNEEMERFRNGAPLRDDQAFLLVVDQAPATPYPDFSDDSRASAGALGSHLQIPVESTRP